MKKHKLLMIVVLAFISVLITGCEMPKDEIIDEYDNGLHIFSKNALTKDKNLQGEKEQGDDEYTGSYSADYQDYSDTEQIFGATGLKRENGNTLHVTYTIEIESGEVQLNWIHSGSVYTLTDKAGIGTIELTIESGDNYISLKGKDFTGSLSLKVE